MKFLIGAFAGATTCYVARVYGNMSWGATWCCSMVAVFMMRGILEAAWKD